MMRGIILLAMPLAACAGEAVTAHEPDPPGKRRAEDPLEKGLKLPEGSTVVWRYVMKDTEFNRNGLLGDLLIEADGKRFVYRFSPNYRDYNADIPISGRADPARPLLQTAAGYDGREYWIASFLDDEGALSWQATAMDLYSSDSLEDSVQPAVREARPGDRLWMTMDGQRYYARHISPWYSHAPLHNMLRFLECPSLDDRALRKSLTKKYVAKVGPHTYKIESTPAPLQHDIPDHWQVREPDSFEHTVELDSCVPPIKRCGIRWPTDWTGVWPYPVPFEYAIVRIESSKTSDTVFSPKGYVGEKTVISEK